MIYLECPAVVDRNTAKTMVFMAGGISNCPDWQDYAARQLQTLDDDLVLINPRRHGFDITNENMTKDQIRWEHDALHKADAIMFWFPCETVCPITLFELGVHAGKVPLFVGTHPEYTRRLDVIEQLSLIDPTIRVYDDLNRVLDEVWNYFQAESSLKLLANHVREVNCDIRCIAL